MIVGPSLGTPEEIDEMTGSIDGCSVEGDLEGYSDGGSTGGNELGLLKVASLWLS